MDAYRYDPVFNAKDAVENKAGASMITILLILEFMIFYCALMSPFLFSWEMTLMVFLGYFI